MGSDSFVSTDATTAFFYSLVRRYEAMTTSSPNSRLYSARGILVATALGSVVAGSYLMIRNFRALHDPKSARNCILAGTAAFVGVVLVTVLIGGLIPSGASAAFNGFLVGVQVVAAHHYLKRYQLAALDNHAQQSLPFYSAWRAVGIGTSVSATIYSLTLLALVLIDPMETR